MPTRAMMAGSRTLMFAMEKAMRSRWKVGRFHSHMMRPHMSCSSLEMVQTRTKARCTCAS